eukprot:ctg_1567.g588
MVALVVAVAAAAACNNNASRSNSACSPAASNSRVRRDSMNSSRITGGERSLQCVHVRTRWIVDVRQRRLAQQRLDGHGADGLGDVHQLSGRLPQFERLLAASDLGAALVDKLAQLRVYFALHQTHSIGRG